LWGFDLLEFGFDHFTGVGRGTATIFDKLKGGIAPYRCAIEPLIEVIEKLGTLLERAIMIHFESRTVQDLLDARFGVLDDTLEFKKVSEFGWPVETGPILVFRLMELNLKA
jgi:hypothetical protein